MLAKRGDLVVGGEPAEGVRVRAQRFEVSVVEPAGGVVELERRRERDPLGREAGEQRARPGGRRGGLLARDQLLDVLLGDEAALVDLGDVDAVALGERERLLRRLLLGRGGLRRGRLLRGSSRVALELRELLRVLGNARDRLPELDLDALVVELHDRSGAWRRHLHRRLRRLDHAHRLVELDLRPVLDEPLREERELGVRVLARQDDLQHCGG